MPSERVQRRIDALLDDADAALAQRDWQSAAEICQAVLVLDPESEDAQSFLAAAQKALAERGDESAFGATDQPSEAMAAPDSVDQPTSFANGRYKVTGFLGEGGKKKVYLAHDTTLDRDVAFALIKTEGLDDASRQRVTREAQAMARLGDNPNIMPIFDLGDENGQPYMVQPLMGGGDVEALIEDAEDGRLSLEEALRIASEICRGLEFAHSKSIIHRDLKPGNVWLTDDGTARIGDFGLALSLDRSRLTQEKMMVGTVSYMPPEQAIGGEVTPRSDLYSLGAMLYEMVTGRPPFMGDDEIAIIGQHINTPPVAPSWHNQSLPQTLDSLIMRLLSKNSAERPESAAEVLQALEAIDPAEAAAARDEEQGSLDSMSGGVFVGRHREMDQLKAIFEDTLGGHGKMVALVGEPGIGKTRTAQELATYASMRGGQVLWGRCYEGGGAPPYWPWVQAIRSYVMDRDAETVRREMGSTASVIAEIVPDVKERLPDVQPPPQIDDPESARFRLFDSIATFLKSASNAQPVVLMLEDLHWSDKPSLLLLEFVARELGNSSLMIVGNYRDMELNRRHPLSVTLGELTRERLFDRVLLRGLQKHDVRRFIEVAAGIDPPDSLVSVVHTQTEGNPLFVTETVRLLIQEGDIASGAKATGGTSSWEIRIPEGVREVIGRRLNRLSERCNEVLITAAVIGRQFRFGVLMNLVEDSSEDMLLDVLDEALDARIVEEVPSEVGLYQFAHALMQETLTAELSANRAVRLHARIAEALEKFYGDEAESNASELAGHFARAESVLGSEKAIWYATAAGRTALAGNAYESAEIQFAQALGFIDGDEKSVRRAETLHGLGLSQIGTVDRSQINGALDTLGRAVDLYLEIGHDDKAVEAASPYVVEVPGTSDIAGLMERALPAVDPDSPDSAVFLARYAHYLSSERNDGAASNRYFSDAERLAEKSGNEGAKFEVMWRRVVRSMHAGELDNLAENAAEAIDLARVYKDDFALGGLLTAAYAAYSQTGRTDLAMQMADQVVQLAEESRQAHSVEHAAFLKTALYCRVGDWKSAGNWIERGLGATPKSPRMLGLRAFIALTRGDLDKGLADFDSLVEQFELIDPRANWVSVFVAQCAPPAYEATGESKYLEIGSAACQAALNDPLATKGRLESANLLYAVIVGRMRVQGTACDMYEEISRLPPGVWAEPAYASGLLAWTCGELEIASGQFNESIERNGEAGYRPDLAWTCSDYAKMLLERDDPGDREKATELQDEAIAIAQELGMQPLLERVLAQREILKA